MPAYKTPDVYVEEKTSFPPSVAEVGTAIPAFVGYTERRPTSGAEPVPIKIHSFNEYRELFGDPQVEDIAITVTDAGDQGFSHTVTKRPTLVHNLYYAVRMYFDNGGGQCYVVSVGGYGGGPDADALTAGLAAVALEDEPTLLVVPEAVRLSAGKYQVVAQAMLKQCGDLMDRFAILDLYDGDKKPDVAQQSRERIVSEHLKYGAAYYPFVVTTLSPFVDAAESNVSVKLGDAERTLASFNQVTGEAGAAPNTAVYNYVKKALQDEYLVMPPSGGVAGVYAATDGARGVWKAPANVSLADVLRPLVKIDSDLQQDLNVDTEAGKSINALRAFTGKGTLVWGARTLAGNDNEWRYVSVRRFFIMVEESIKKSTAWAVFEPNDANTWVKVRGMIENYLIEKWRDGALAGATPKDAFFVKCGLGSTMTGQDVLEGRLIVEIGLAVVRPAEFIILRFSHKLQTS